MKIRSLFCSCNGRTDNPLDHYEKADCGAVEPGRPERWPMEWLLTLLDEAQGEQYHSQNRLTATRILGCPRETVILDNKAIVYDVRSGHSPFCGTLKHRALKQRARPGAFAELKLEPFEFGGAMLEGILDTVQGDFKLIRDWKSHSESSQEFKYKDFQKGKLDAEGAAQNNIYRIGVAKGILKIPPEQYRPTMIITHLADVKRDGVAFFDSDCPIMSEEQILALRPHDDDEHPMTQPYTVKELMGQLIAAHARIRKIPEGSAERAKEIDSIIADMPMVGRNIWRWKYNRQTRRREKINCGDKCMKYCAAKFDCFALEVRKQTPAGLNTPAMPAGLDLGLD